MINYSEILSRIRETTLQKLPEYHILILRNITLEPYFENYLQYHILRLGYRAQIHYGNYDMIAQDATDKLLFNRVDCVLVFQYLETESPMFSRYFLRCKQSEIESETGRILSKMQKTITDIRKQTDAPILWSGFELPIYPSDSFNKTNYSQMRIINDLNRQLQELSQPMMDVHILDLDACIRRVGAEQFYHLRGWYAFRAPYGKCGCDAIAWEVSRHVCDFIGHRKKCLVLDCDNVLWGGIIGEDGINGIQLGDSGVGAAYQDFQAEILNLCQQGVILALCSKNNACDVWEVFHNHPGMVLKPDHIAAYKINWDNKVNNICALAEELHLGLDSMVFADDSEFEIEMVRKYLPKITTMLMPVERPHCYRTLLASCGYFDVHTLTREDRERVKMYKAQSKREQLYASCANMDEYLASLKIQVIYHPLDAFHLSRVAQLTQRTNQFNMNPIRYTPQELDNLVHQPDYDSFCVEISDRFGNFGTVGACLLRYEQRRAIIEQFLLSCRALGRDVEKQMLSHCMKLIRNRGYDHVAAHYVQTERNGMVKEFMQKSNIESI